MMDFIVKNFETFSKLYMGATIEIVFAVTALLYAYWLRPFTQKRIAAYIAGIVYWIVDFISHHVDTVTEIDNLLKFAGIIIIVYVAWFIDEKRNLIQKFYLSIVFTLTSWVTQELLSEIGFYERDFIFQYDIFISDTTIIIMEFVIWNIIQYGLMLLLLYLAVRLLHKVYKNKSDELSWREFVMLMMPSGCLLLVKPIIRAYFRLWMDGIANGSIKANIPGSVYRILFCIFSYLSVLIIVKLYQEIKENQYCTFADRALESQIEDTKSHVQRVEEIYEQMRAMRHDMRNHMTVIERLAETGNKEELTEYIGEWQSRFEAIQPKIKTGNAIIDVILSEFADRCKQENIVFESQFIYPDGVMDNPFDMSVILNNAIQNAIEASKEVEDPKIMLISAAMENGIIISVKNRISGRVSLGDEGLPVSTKVGAGHGYGLKNIRSIAQRYKGDIEIRQDELEEGTFFILNVMMIAKK